MNEPLPPVPPATESQSRGTGRRGVWPLAIGLVLLAITGLVFAFSSLSLQLGDAREELEARLAHLTGQPIHVDGAVSFELLPRPTAVLTDLRARTGAGERAQLLTVDRVEARFALLPALLGRAEIQRIALVRPELMPAGADAVPDLAPSAARKPRPPQVGTPGDMPVGAASRDLQLFLVRFEGLREIDIRDGLFRIPGRADNLSNVNLTFIWPGGESSAFLAGSAVWNGQPVHLETKMERPLPFTKGESSALTLALSSPALDVSFDGKGSAGERLSLTGALGLSTPSLSRAVDWIGRENSGLPDFGAFAIQTQIQLVDDRISLGSASLDVGGDKGRGSLEAVLPRGDSKPPSVSGTLAFRKLDFGRFSQAIAPKPQTILDLQRPIHTDFLRNLDLDLRLSAEQADLGETDARDVAATIKAMGGVGTVDIGDMTLLGGRGDLRITIDTNQARPDLTLSAGLRDVDVSNVVALTDGAPMPLSSGRGDLQLTLRGPATNWGEIALACRTEAKLRVRDGELAGIERGMLAAPGPRPIDPATATPEPFRRGELALAGVGPHFRIDKLAIAFDKGEASATGTVDLRSSRLLVQGQFDPAKEEASGVSNSFTISKPIGFKLDGEWPKPTLTVSASDGPT